MTVSCSSNHFCAGFCPSLPTMTPSNLRPPSGVSVSSSGIFASIVSNSTTIGGPPTTPTPTASRDPRDPSRRPQDGKSEILGSARALEQLNISDTPHHDSIDQSSFDPDMEEQKEIVEKELGKSIVELPKDSTFASSLYHNHASSDEIEMFLKETEVYRTEDKRWDLPQARSGEILLEAAIYEPLVKVLKAILSKFQTGASSSKREVIDTHSTNLPHKEPGPTTHFSRPDISVKARGPSFQLPHKETRSNVGFSNMATCFEVKAAENKKWTLMKNLLQLAVYARYAQFLVSSSMSAINFSI